MDNTIQTNISAAINAYVQTANNNAGAAQNSDVREPQTQQKAPEQPATVVNINNYTSNKNIINSNTTDISKNEITGDVVVKFLDLKKNLVSQEPPIQYLKIKEMTMSTGRIFDRKF